MSRSVRTLLLRPEAASFAGLLLVLGIFSLLSPLFLTYQTFITIASTASELGIVAVCVTLLMIGGYFDLSIGAIIGLSGLAVLYGLQAGLHPLVAILLAPALGAAIGAINGILVVVTKLHSFIVTLGTMLILRSVLNVAVQGVPTKLGLPPEWAMLISGPNLGGFRMSLLWMVVFAAIATVFLLRSRQGNWTYAMGQNKVAARNLGVPVRGMTILVYAVSGLGAAVLGLLQAARFDSVDGTRGTGLELYVITVVVVGGTSLFGGYGSALGTVFGAVTFAMIQIGLVLSGTPGYFFEGLIGISLFIAVIVNQWFLGNVDRMGRRRDKAPVTTDTAAPETKS